MNTSNAPTKSAGEDVIRNFPEDWYDIRKLDKPLDWEAFLQSDILETERSNQHIFSVTSRTSATISVIASILLIVHILRSHQRLSTTIHRLVLGLSIGDILYSSGSILGPVMIPQKDLDYWVQDAQGNVGTCTFQGFIITVGLLMSAYYNCSICFYFQSIIKYNKSSAYIKNKQEPWLHAIPIIVSLGNGFIVMAVKGYNAWGQVCLPVRHLPPHCTGYDVGHVVEGFSIPCGRGHMLYESLVYQLLFFVIFFSVPIIIVTTMVSMYLTVRKIERNAQRYGVKTLRVNVQRRRNEESGVVRQAPWRRRSKGKKRRLSRKRAVLQMAGGFTSAWCSVWIPLFLTRLPQTRSFEILVIGNILGPLQGLFNFIVFMSPKVRGAKKPSRGQRELNWCEAIIKAYMLRGERGERSQMLRSSGQGSRNSSGAFSFIRLFPSLTKQSSS